jgi:hypothetical protein
MRSICKIISWFFINDKIDTDFSDIPFGNENGESREERLNNYAKWIYKCQNLHSLTKKLQYLFMLERKNFYWKHFW